MALPRKPPQTPTAPEPKEAEIVRFINEGGSTAGQPIAATAPAPLKKPVHVLDFHDQELMDRVNAACRKPFKKPRNQWILEAIYEKLQREGS